jgi:hypothetical protein
MKNVDQQLWELLAVTTTPCTCKNGQKCKACQAKVELEIIKHQMTAFLETV